MHHIHLTANYSAHNSAHSETLSCHSLLIDGSVSHGSLLRHGPRETAWGRLELRRFSVNDIFISQMFLLNPLNHDHIRQVSPQPSCFDTCHVWTWYTIDSILIILKKGEADGTEGNGLVTATPVVFHRLRVMARFGCTIKARSLNMDRLSAACDEWVTEKIVKSTRDRNWERGLLYLRMSAKTNGTVYKYGYTIHTACPVTHTFRCFLCCVPIMWHLFGDCIVN